MTPQQEKLIHDRLNSLRDDNTTIYNNIVQLRNQVAELTELVDARTGDNEDAKEEMQLVNADNTEPALLQQPTVRVLLVVGHNPVVQGAYSPHLQQSEYNYNLALARKLEGSRDVMYDDVTSQLTLETSIAYRTDNSSRREFLMQTVVPMLQTTDFDLIIELHFNSFIDPSATGMELLHATGSAEARHLFETLLNGLSILMPLRNRGLKQLKRDERGFSNVTMSYGYSSVPYCILEPFFGSNKLDCHMAEQQLHNAVSYALGNVARHIVMRDRNTA